METKRIIFLTGFIVVLSGLVYAQNPEGMEYQNYGQGIGRQEQKGLQQQMVGNVAVIESNKEFAARSVDQLAQEVAQLSQVIAALRNEVDQIRGAVVELQNLRIDSMNKAREMFTQLQQQINALYEMVAKMPGGSQTTQGQSGMWGN